MTDLQIQDQLFRLSLIQIECNVDIYTHKHQRKKLMHEIYINRVCINQHFFPMVHVRIDHTDDQYITTIKSYIVCRINLDSAKIL